MNILKIEAFSGLSGDMFLGALAELTDAYDELTQLPDRLHLANVEVKVSDMNKAGIACKHVKIIDHNIYNADSHSHLTHADGPHHHHSHKPGDKPVKVQLRQNHHGQHRHLTDIELLIDQGDIPDAVKISAKKIFHLLGEAESKVHGVDISSLHFHEVGAIDSILDIVGTAFLLNKLKIDHVVATPVCTGHGFVMAEHGRMPIPAPATKELLLGIPTYAGKESGEMTTPTGAAILQFLNPSFTIPALIERKTAHGPGEKEFPHPNVLRLTLCESAELYRDDIIMVESNIDDMSYQMLGNDFQDRLFEAGALDFYYTQVIMKKGRPGIVISVFTTPDMVREVSNFLLENTTTIGVRTYSASRHILKRREKSLQTSLGVVRVKEVDLPSGRIRITPEYESIKDIAIATQRPINEILSQVNLEINRL